MKYLFHLLYSVKDSCFNSPDIAGLMQANYSSSAVFVWEEVAAGLFSAKFLQVLNHREMRFNIRHALSHLSLPAHQ